MHWDRKCVHLLGSNLGSKMHADTWIKHALQLSNIMHMLASLGSNMYWDWTYSWKQPTERREHFRCWYNHCLCFLITTLVMSMPLVMIEDSTAFMVPADLIISHMHNIQWDRICTLGSNVQTLGSCTCVYWDPVAFVCDITIHSGVNISDIDIIRSLFIFLDHYFGWCHV